MITGHRSSFARIWRALHSMRTMTVSRKFQNYPIQLLSLRSSFRTKFSIPLLSPWSFQIFHPQLLKHRLLLIQSIVHRLLPLALLSVTCTNCLALRAAYKYKAQSKLRLYIGLDGYISDWM